MKYELVAKLAKEKARVGANAVRAELDQLRVELKSTQSREAEKAEIDAESPKHKVGEAISEADVLKAMLASEKNEVVKVKHEADLLATLLDLAQS